MTTAATTEVKARPILFSSEMVRAILDGRKSMTRRIVKFLDDGKLPIARGRGYVVAAIMGDEGPMWSPVGGDPLVPMPPNEYAKGCPYGQPGDLLFVRETWQAFEPTPHVGTGREAINRIPMRVFARPPIEGHSVIEYAADHPERLSGWRSPIHLPRWASRLTLRVTDVRVERVCDFVRHGPDVAAVAEGFGIGNKEGDADDDFSNYWHNLHGVCAEDDRRWCWVVSFTPEAPHA